MKEVHGGAITEKREERDKEGEGRDNCSIHRKTSWRGKKRLARETLRKKGGK